MEQGNIIWVVLIVSVLGLIGLGSFIFFAIAIFKPRWMFKSKEDFFKSHEFHILSHKLCDSYKYQETIAILAASYEEYLQKRNDLWTSYGQIVLALFIVIVLTILLLTKTISGEAGLPILSAISGFAIAKGASAMKNNIHMPSKRNNE